MASSKDAANALIDQAEHFYRASKSNVKAANPLLLYYSFMNLAKAFILNSKSQDNVNNAQHGLSECLDDSVASPVELVNAYLEAHQSRPTTTNLRINNFKEVTRAAIV